MSCIYRVLNLINGKSYIGFAIDLEDRKAVHFCEAFTRKSNFIFHKALRKYGSQKFVWGKIIEGHNGNFLMSKMEPYFINLFNTHYIDGHGYNMTYGGDGILGYKFTDEQIKNLSKSHLGKKLSNVTRKKISSSHLGVCNTPEHNQNIALAASKKWVVIRPNGGEVEIINLKKFCDDNGLRYSAMHRISIGKMKQHRGFKCKAALMGLIVE